MYSNEQILSCIMRLSTDSSTVVSVRDMASDDIVSRTCVLKKCSLSSGDALSSASKYEQMKQVLSSAAGMSEPVLSVIWCKGDAKRASYCIFSGSETLSGSWSRMSRQKARKPIIDTIASLRLWIAYPHLRYAKLPMG